MVLWSLYFINFLYAPLYISGLLPTHYPRWVGGWEDSGVGGYQGCSPWALRAFWATCGSLNVLDVHGSVPGRLQGRRCLFSVFCVFYFHVALKKELKLRNIGIKDLCCFNLLMINSN